MCKTPFYKWPLHFLLDIAPRGREEWSGLDLWVCSTKIKGLVALATIYHSLEWLFPNTHLWNYPQLLKFNCSLQLCRYPCGKIWHKNRSLKRSDSFAEMQGKTLLFLECSADAQWSRSTATFCTVVELFTFDGPPFVCLCDLPAKRQSSYLPIHKTIY